MSLPIQSNNQPSNSPSKSSLRRTSANSGKPSTTTHPPSPGPTTHFASEATQHHFLLHSPPNQNLEYDEDEDEEAVAYDDSASYQTAPQPPVPFQPFFALIEDTSTNEHYHPAVHYIFADDEPDIVTEAACRSLDQNTEESNLASRSEQEQQQQQDQDHDYPSRRLPPPQPGVKEHYLILDVQPSPLTIPSSQHQFSDRLPSPSPSSVETAHALIKQYPFTVTDAQSLSSDWQILRTSITDAPTMNAEQQHPDEQHLMLRIEGRGNSPDRALQRREGEGMEDLIDRFQTRLAEIRCLMVDLEGGNEQRGGHVVGEDQEEEVVGRGGGGDMFSQSGLVGMGFRPTGFGNAVLDEQD